MGFAMLPLLVAATATGPALPQGSPPPGRYDAQLCVSVTQRPPDCGPVVADVDEDGGLTVRVHDFRYVLAFEQGLLVGITMHGAMQVAEFLSSYRWAGDTLLFGDRPRGLQYELRIAPRRTAPVPAPASG